MKIFIATLYAGAMRHGTRFWRDERAATAIEYGMIAAGVGAAIAATVFSLGSSVKTNLYQKISDMFN